jgi:hypothetical protein
MHRALVVVPLLLCAVAACAPSSYRYAPVMLTNAELEGRPAIEAVVPADEPRGKMRVVPLGIAKVTPPQEGEQPEFSALYVRLAIENQSTETWTFDQAAQSIVTKWRGDDFQTYATTPTGVRAPVVAIAAGSTLRVDLMFELPPGATKPDHVEGFDVLWVLRAGTRDVSGRAAFQRLSADPAVLRGVHETIPPPQRGPGRYGPRPER